MAITVAGVTGSVNAGEWSLLLIDAANLPCRMSVPSGFSAQVSTSTRGIVLTAGRTWQAGTNLTSNASVTVPIAPLTGSNNVYDVIYAQVDWSGTKDTAGSIDVQRGVASANPVLPDLTQQPGSLWRTPIAYFLTHPGSGLLSASNLTIAHPTPHGTTSVTTDANGAFTVAHNMWVVPNYAEVSVKNINFRAAVSDVDKQNLTARVVLFDGTLAANHTFTAYWKVGR